MLGHGVVSPTVRIGVLSDVHLAGADAPPASWHHRLRLESSADLLDAALDHLAGAGVDAVLACGDLTQAGDAESTEAAVARLRACGAPVLVAVGNHDVIEADDRVASVVGRVVGGADARVRLVDGTGTPIAPGVRVAGTQVASDDKGWHARATEVAATDRWAGDLTVWATHYPTLTLRERLSGAGLGDAGDLDDDRGQRAALLSRTAPTLVVHGHQHTRAVTCSGTVAQWSQAAVVEPPHDVTVLTIERTSGGWRAEARATSLLGAGDPRPRNVLCPGAVRLTYTAGEWSQEDLAA